MIKDNHSPLWGKPPFGLISGIVPCMFDKLDLEKHRESKGGSKDTDISIIFIYFSWDGIQNSGRIVDWGIGIGLLLRGGEHWAFTPLWSVSRCGGISPLKAILRALRSYTVSLNDAKADDPSHLDQMGNCAVRAFHFQSLSPDLALCYESAWSSDAAETHEAAHQQH